MRGEASAEQTQVRPLPGAAWSNTRLMDKDDEAVLSQCPPQALLQEADDHQHSLQETTFYEVTIASVDQQKLLSRLSEALVRLPSPAMGRSVSVLALKGSAVPFWLLRRRLGGLGRERGGRGGGRYVRW